MTAAAILADLRRSGIQVVADGDTLRLRGPASALTDDVRQAVAAAKPEILQTLQHTSQKDIGSGLPVLSVTPTVPRPGKSRALPPVWLHRLRAAGDWLDLAEIVDDAQAAYVTGQLHGDIVERVAVQALILSRSLPEHRLPPPPAPGAEQ